MGNDQENSHKKLIVWQVADELASKIYEVTAKFPREEVFSFTSQLRRAALSVPLNIVEGFARNNKNEFRHFLSISLGSLAETGYLLEFSLKQKFLSKEEFTELNGLRDRCGQLLWKLYKSQSERGNTQNSMGETK